MEENVIQIVESVVSGFICSANFGKSFNVRKTERLQDQISGRSFARILS
jgi:hypothetical protein